MRFPEHGIQRMFGLVDQTTNNGLETHKIMTVPVRSGQLKAEG
jgi:hypothetical protein